MGVFIYICILVVVIYSTVVMLMLTQTIPNFWRNVCRIPRELKDDIIFFVSVCRSFRIVKEVGEDGETRIYFKLINK